MIQRKPNGLWRLLSSKIFLKVKTSKKINVNRQIEFIDSDFTLYELENPEKVTLIKRSNMQIQIL